jgi:hypothetical protein
LSDKFFSLSHFASLHAQVWVFRVRMGTLLMLDEQW